MMDTTPSERSTGKLRGGGRAAPDWVVEYELPEVPRAIGFLVNQGLKGEEARDLVWTIVASCEARKEPPRDPRAYFWGAVVNELFQELRDMERRMEPLIEEPPARGPDPLEQAVAKDLEEQVEAILASFPEEVAAVGRLRLAGWEPAEIAERLELRPRTARRYWRRVRDALREGLDL